MTSPSVPSEALVARYDQAGPRYTSYPTVPAWSPLVSAHTHAEQLRLAAGKAAPLSLYFHLPFCARLCTYCGCNMVITRDQSRADSYTDDLIREMDLVVERLGARTSVSQLHWGGGTPTFFDERQLTRLWEEIASRFTLTPEAEVSVEVNPAVTSVRQMEVLRGLGFNRVSMGVQDFDPLVQKTINRYQTEEQTRILLEAARGLGFSGVNFDLVYGLPHQTQESWQRTLDQVLRMRPDRFAIYAFAYMPDQIPHQRKLPVAAMAKGPDKLSLFLAAWSQISDAGYRAIGMDHFALPGDELSLAQERRALGRNFQGYTVQSAQDVVALGASGISDLGGVYAQNARGLDAYRASVQRGELAVVKGFVCSEDDLRRRQIINGLMCNFWTDLGPDAGTRYAPELERLAPLREDGLVELRGGEVSVTPLGRFFVRNVAMAFDAYLREGQRFSRTV